ncbi:MAG TPA: ABC transporter permease [Gemmatimonadaceae bacterium]|nr:ABC transporter permease [Gemmatimonadaceae bacterium]
MTWFHAVRARLRLLPRQAAESRIDDEIAFHIEMETQRLMREQKLDPEEAKRRALVAFGGVQQHRETLREGRGTAWLSGLTLDFKLGLRMLLKYPGLTIVGGLAMAFGIWFGAVTFEMFGVITSTKLPLPDGDRIVKVLYWDTKTNAAENRTLYDYRLWRTARSFTDLGAYRDASVNLVGKDGGAHPANAAAITAAAFRIAPDRPLHGRVLDESDERAGAAPVVVLGHELWTERFGSDPRIIGRNVQLGSSFATVVGVMPEGYGFPVSHQLWLPLRTDVAGVEPLGGFPITVFGRLASGITLENAKAELTALSQRLAAEHPTTHAQLQPHVIAYTKHDIDSGDMPQVTALTYFFIVVLMVVVCSTVALMLFARAASRQTEILVRSALGASRRRIVTQLFAEALVLAGVAAAFGLAAAQLTLKRLGEPYLVANYDQLPFWYEFDLSLTSIVAALSLAVIGAVVAGVMPARKITRGLGTQLRAGTAGGGVSFGGVWTAVIVTQVALTVALPSVVMLVRGERNRIASYDAGFPTNEYLGVTLDIDAPPDETLTADIRAALDGQFRRSLGVLRQRLQAEPGVAGVTFVDRLPGESHIVRQGEVVSLPGSAPKWVSTAAIDPSYFTVLRSEVVSGRAFNESDLSPDVRVAIVDEGFVERLMPGQNPIGHRVRLTSGEKGDTTAAQQPLYEIVGLVKDLGVGKASQTRRPAGLYLPTTPGSMGALGLIVHARGDPLTLAPRVREVATRVDPALRIEQMTRLDQMETSQIWFFGLWMKVIFGLTAVALLLSLAGIYAILSYTVARRTREIGVRVALGASAGMVITSIFRSPLTQVVLGVTAGSVLIATGWVALQRLYPTRFAALQYGGLTLEGLALLAGYAILMFGVCMLACVVPTARALRVQPTEALRAE